MIITLMVLAPLGALIISSISGGQNTQNASRQTFLGTQQLVLLGRSVLLAVMAGAGGTMAGLVVGYAVASRPANVQRRMAIGLMLPFSIPPFVQALVWIMLAQMFGLSVHGFFATVLVLAGSFWPIAALLTWIGLRQSAVNGIEAARMGESRLRAFTRIELGLIRPHLVTAFLVIALFSFSDYGVPSLFRINTYPVYVFSQFAAFYDLHSGVMASWPYLLLPLVASWIWYRKAGVRFIQSRGFGFRSCPRVFSPVFRSIWVLTYWAAILVTLGLPLTVLAIKAGHFQTYWTAWQTAKGQIGMSAMIAAASATLMALMAFPLALGIQGRFAKGSQLLNLASILPIALPGTLFGMGEIYLWNRTQTHWIYGSATVVIFLYIARFLPFALRPQVVGLAQIEEGLLDASRLSERSSFNTTWRIILPLLSASIMAGWALAFMLSLQELTGTLLVVPPGMETLAVRIYTLYHYGAGQLVAALALFLVALSGLMFAVLTIFHQWIQRR
jgi:iron(III) transport system permease protein